MRIVTWAIRLVLLVLLAAFAAKNVEPVTLRFYFDLALQTPLILALFAFFALGALVGVFSLLGTLLRQRMQISSLRKRVPPAEPEPPAPAP
jgi:putative membrane protein